MPSLLQAHPLIDTVSSFFLEAQQMLDKHLGLSSVHVKGTRGTSSRKEQLVFMKQDKAQMIDKLSREYGKILGFD